MEGGPLSAPARVDALWTKRAHRGVMDPHAEARFVAGRGIEGNTCRSSTRQVTIISREAWESMMHDLGASLDPAARRANVMVSGVDLALARGKVLRLGRVRVRILGETRPCERMDEAHDGLRAAMDPQWRGGAFGEVLDDGVVKVGDAVAWESVVGPRIVAIVMLLFSVNALAQAFRQAVGWDGGPVILGLEQLASGATALAAATGAWLGRWWAAPATALYGLLAAILIATLGPVLDLEPDGRSGLFVGAGIVVTVCLALAWYLRRALPRRRKPPVPADVG